MKTFFRLTLALLIAGILSGSSCDMNDSIWFHNDSGDSVVVRFFYEWPDTALCSGNAYVGYHKQAKLIKPGALFRQLLDYYGKQDYKFLFRNADTLSAYVIHFDTLRKYGWWEVERRRLWLHRYDITYRDLDRSGGHLYYPPF